MPVAARIIESSSREHPADSRLREELRVARLPATAASRAATIVFDYFRWLQWLDRDATIRAQARQAQELAMRFAEKPSSFPDAEMISRAVPSWLKGEMKVSPAFARALQTPPRIWLRARPGCADQVKLALEGCSRFGTGHLDHTLLYSGHEDLFRSPSFKDGAFEIQDISSQAVGFVCAPEKGQVWWDCCAGEGGKTLHLSALMGNTGLVWASDRAEWRLRILKKRAARARVFNYRLVPWNGGEKLPTRTMFDGVLVDAPCSGVGTWQRNPHARWTTTPEDVAELAQLQGRLLANSARAVKPGGRLVYAVCSLTRSETTFVARTFETMSPGFEPIALENPLAQGRSDSPHLWLWPQNTNGNGMFIAAWRRRS